jgi:DNA-binding Lrp family transcriptional regulator
MDVVDQNILNLKADGNSLRQIASALGISHEAVRKRLKAVKDKDQVSTTAGDRKLTASTIEKEKVSTGSKAHQSRASEELGDVVNRVSTSNAPCPTITEGVNPLETPSDKLPDVSQGVFSEVDSLSEEIKQFLEAKGIEVYRMQVGQEAYQVKHCGQVIRFYIFREKNEKKFDSSPNSE